jgi:hypothetical protein
MKSVLRHITVFMITVSTAYSQTQVPKCFADYQPSYGHGFVNDVPNQAPRTILNVWVDPNLNANVHSGVGTATTEWNDATNSNGQHIPLSF